MRTRTIFGSCGPARTSVGVRGHVLRGTASCSLMSGAIAGSGTALGVLSLAGVLAIGAALWFTFSQREAARRAVAGRLGSDVPLPAQPSRPPAAPSPPWWGNPWCWAIVCLAFAVLGLVVWPGLFGGTFLLLPFVWIRRPRRDADMDPRTNGHTDRDPESFTGD
jgi:hypothetical protein